jgi:hypothetical protein
VKEIAQNVAQTIFCQIEYTTFSAEKSSTKIWSIAKLAKIRPIGEIRPIWSPCMYPNTCFGKFKPTLDADWLRLKKAVVLKSKYWHNLVTLLGMLLSAPRIWFESRIHKIKFFG